MRTLAICTLAAAILAASPGSAQEEASYRVEFLSGVEPTAWQAEAPARRQGDLLLVPAGTARATILFPGGRVDLDLLDIGVWDRAHVVGVSVRAAGSSLTFGATVRHRDEGWDHYANAWRVRGEEVGNGERVLLHPHDEEQPFTRSQSGVEASGEVTVEAEDLVHGLGGSVVLLDLAALELPFEIRYAVGPPEGR